MLLFQIYVSLLLNSLGFAFLFMPPADETGRQRRYLLILLIRSSVHPFVVPLPNVPNAIC